VGAERPAPPRPDQRPVRLARSSWVTLVAATAVALVAIALFPRFGGDAPPLASLALIGAVIAGVTTVALYTIVRRDLRLPSRAVTSLALAFGLIALVKFVLAPLGLYEVNAVKALTDVFASVVDPVGASITAVTVFGLYALGYAIVYWLFGGELPSIRRRRSERERRGPVGARRVLVVLLIAGLLAVSGLWVIALVLVLAPVQYLAFVFSSGAGVLMTIALIGAATLIGSAFRTLGEHLEVVPDVGAIVTLFWLGLGFLALYHVLWIVYVLVLGSIWPLRTVTPK
jgi:hypothetical protein